MPRPNRLYTIDGKYYYIKDGKKVFVKVPAGVSQKQVSKINIKNIIKLAETKRVVRKKKRRNLSYQKKIAPTMEKAEPSGLPIYFFKPKREILTIDQIADASDDTTIQKLSKQLLKDATLQASSSKLPTEPTIATPSVGSRLKKFFTPKKKSTTPSTTPSTPLTSGTLGTQEATPATPAGAFVEPEGPKRKVNVAGARTRIRSFLSNPFNRGTPTQEDITTPGSKITPGTFGRAKADVNVERGVGLERTLSFNPVPEDQGGKGYDSSDGLYDDEIETIAKKRLKDYIPCIAKDETQQLLKYVKKGDKQFAFVINTDNSDQPGRHWRCVYINNMDDYPSIEYFDPLTEGKPEQSLIDICRKIAIKMNPQKLFKYKQNMIRRQSKLSSNCGYHCIHFLEGRYMGVPFSEITGYDEFVDKMKKEHGDLDGSGQGESELKPFMKKYDSYI